MPGLKNCPNVVFDQMDVAAMTYPANCFDIVVLYNALAHVELVLDPLLEGCPAGTEAGRLYAAAQLIQDG